MNGTPYDNGRRAELLRPIETCVGADGRIEQRIEVRMIDPLPVWSRNVRELRRELRQGSARIAAALRSGCAEHAAEPGAYCWGDPRSGVRGLCTSRWARGLAVTLAPVDGGAR